MEWKTKLTCDDNGYISFQHLETSEAPDICTFCKNSRQMGELRGSGEERRTPQCDFGLESQKDTICMWTSRQSMHEQHWLYVAIWYQYKCSSANSGGFLPWCYVLHQVSNGGNLSNGSHLWIWSIFDMVICILDGTYCLLWQCHLLDSNPSFPYGTSIPARSLGRAISVVKTTWQVNSHEIMITS